MNYFGAIMSVMSNCQTRNIAGELNNMFDFKTGLISTHGASNCNGERFTWPIGNFRILGTSSSK